MTKETIEQFLEPKYTRKNLDGVTYRTINYWDGAGFLLRRRRKTEKGWRKFSLIEFIWLKLLSELRTLEIDIEPVIPRLFDAVKFEPSTATGSTIGKAQVNFLQAIAPCFTEKKHIRLNIYPSHAEFATYERTANHLKASTSFVSLSMNKLLAEFIATKIGGLQQVPFLNEHEQEIMEFLNNNELDSLSIRLEDAEVKIESEKSKQTAVKAAAEALMLPYRHITYKTKGGNTISIERRM